MGYVIANNQGIELALKRSADYILLLNNDTVVERNFLDILINYAERNKDFGILSPKILYYNSDKIWSMGGCISYLTGLAIMIGKGKNSEEYNKIIEPDFVTGCAMLIKREVIEKVGMLDPVYFAYYEDVDYCFRVKNVGYKIRVIPKSIVWHKKSASAGIRGSKRKINELQAYLWARNGIIFCKKLVKKKKIILLPAQVIVSPVIRTLSFDNKKAFKKYIKGILDGLRFKI